MKIAKISLGLLGLTALALSAMPCATASAAQQLRPATCSLDECVDAAQQSYACCKNPDAEGCEVAFLQKAPTKSCAQILVSDIAECPGQVLTCEIEELGGGNQRQAK